MALYKVDINYKFTVSEIVEADSEEEAFEVANETEAEFHSVTDEKITLIQE